MKMNESVTLKAHLVWFLVLKRHLKYGGSRFPTNNITSSATQAAFPSLQEL